jgi:hypothetical protein
MAINFNDNIFVSFEGKLLDAKWGPFPDTDAAYTAVDPVYRQIGMFAIINSPSGAQLWWYKNDINTLVPFSGNSSVQVYDVKDESEPSVPGETFFPLTGNLDVIYVDKSTSSSYYWNTSTTPPEYTLTGSGEGFVEVYPSKTGSTPGTDSFPTVGTVNVIYIADDTNISYLWNTALLSGNGDYEIIVGGTIPTLQEVLSKNNTATDKDILLNGTSKVQFENGSKVQKGTTDAGIGGNGGVALKCSIEYELKWEAGRLYIMQQDGTEIREVRYTLTSIPTANDDTTKGFVSGSRWILDNGDTYICTDNTDSAATWSLLTTSTGFEQNFLLMGG